MEARADCPGFQVFPSRDGPRNGVRGYALYVCREKDLDVTFELAQASLFLVICLTLPESCFSGIKQQLVSATGSIQQTYTNL